jgi:uncharacterized protein
MRMSPLLLIVMIAPLCAAPASAQSYRGPITDAHAHLRLGDNDWIRPDQPKGVVALRQLDAAAGIERSALIVIGFGTPAEVRAKNDAVIAAAAADPKHFYAVASVNPDNGDAALAELDRLAARGIKMIKLHPNSQEFDVADPRITKIAQRCGAHGMTVLFDSYNPLDPGQIGKLIKLSVSQPKTRFVLAHMAFSQFRETMAFATLKKLGGPKNVWFDTSVIATAYGTSPVRDELVWTMRQVGMDRIIFGSDWPVDTPGAALAAARQLGLTFAEQRQVFHDNIAELLVTR